MPARSSLVLLASSLALASLTAGTGCGDSAGGGSGTGGGGTTACLDELTATVNSEYCAATPSNPDCALVTGEYKNQSCGVPLKQPPAELVRSSDVEEFGGSGAPNVACFSPASYPTVGGASQAVTMRGFVRIFSNGCESNDVAIEVFEVQADGQLGTRIAATETPESCVDAGEEDNDVEDCDVRWECSYEIEGIPSETPLAVKTSGARWQPLIAYNVYVPTDEIVDATWDFDPRSLATDDYGVIAQAAIGRPITAGNGAIAGEVHDCDDIRVTNAVADVDVQKVALTYFTSNEDSPLPDLGAVGTSKLGLYSAIDVPQGPATVAAAGLVNGQVVSLGRHNIYVYPDTVSSLTFRGLRPNQVPAQ
jgi:hypothetical protein